MTADRIILRVRRADARRQRLRAERGAGVPGALLPLAADPHDLPDPHRGPAARAVARPGAAGLQSPVARGRRAGRRVHPALRALPRLQAVLRALGGQPAAPDAARDSGRQRTRGGQGDPGGAARARRPATSSASSRKGAISRTGNLLPFKRGLEKIVEGLDVPIVPVYLDRVWGSVFSFKGGRFLWKWPARFPYPVTVVVRRAAAVVDAGGGSPRRADGGRGAGDDACGASRARCSAGSSSRPPRRRWGSFCIADSGTPALTYGRALVGVAAAVALDPPPHRGAGRASACCCRRRSAARSPTSRRRSPGKTSVNLNFTAGPRGDGGGDRALRHHHHPHVAQVRREGGHRADRRHGVPRRRAQEHHAAREGAHARHRVPAARRGCWRGSMPTKGTPSRSRRSSSRAAAPASPRASCSAIATSWRTSTRSRRSSSCKPDDVMVGVLPFFHSFGFSVTLWLPLRRRLRRGVPSRTRWTARPSARSAEKLPRHDPRQHADLLRRLHPQVHARAVRPRALCAGRRREAARADRRGVQGEVRHHAARGLRLHRDVAGGRGQRARTSTIAASISAARWPARSAIRCRASSRRSSIPTTGEGPLIGRTGCSW